MDKERIDKKLSMLTQGLDTLIKQAGTLLTLTEQLLEEVYEVKDIVSNKSSLLRFIYHMDKQGVNMTKLLLFQRLSYIKNLDELFIALLKDGEIMEIQEIVYPFNTKNEVNIEEKDVSKN